MRGSRPEVRIDKNGHAVTRHVGRVETSSTPALSRLGNVFKAAVDSAKRDYYEASGRLIAETVLTTNPEAATVEASISKSQSGKSEWKIESVKDSEGRVLNAAAAVKSLKKASWDLPVSKADVIADDGSGLEWLSHVPGSRSRYSVEIDLKAVPSS